jgi:outer membrane lipoprotein-sorting protein
MKKYYLTLFLIITSTVSQASIKDNIIQNLKGINNITFNFEQNIAGKIEKGNCSIQYPKKIFCKYNSKNKKILVSNGKALVIKTKNSYYIYPLKKTPLNYILDKKFLINRINNSEERIIDDKFINFNFIENENEINIFFDKINYNLVGWQTLDIYQNLSITFLFNVIKNQNLKKDMFFIPSQN